MLYINTILRFPHSKVMLSDSSVRINVAAGPSHGEYVTSAISRARDIRRLPLLPGYARAHMTLGRAPFSVAPAHGTEASSRGPNPRAERVCHRVCVDSILLSLGAVTESQTL